ncbi:MAG: F0F1 ATP synthase subunit delta [Parcubacteria group bacterium]|nr:F0F1 ATP synthase subunit delta [Parcubacteria group bacterium]
MKTDTYAKAFIKSIEGKEAHEVLARLKEILRQKNELYLLPSILRKAVILLGREKGTTVLSRYALDVHSKEKIITLLQKNFHNIKTDSIQFHLDKKILGGVSISHQDFLFDGTINGALAEFKK